MKKSLETNHFQRNQTFQESLPIEKPGSFSGKLFRPWMAMPISKRDAKEQNIQKNEKMSYENIAISSKINDAVSYHAFLNEVTSFKIFYSILFNRLKAVKG